MEVIQVDVVVVGAGPVGIATACALAAKNRSVLIIDEESKLCCGESAHAQRIIHSGHVYTALKGSLFVKELFASSKMWGNKEHLRDSIHNRLAFGFRDLQTATIMRSRWDEVGIPPPKEITNCDETQAKFTSAAFPGGVYLTNDVLFSPKELLDGLSCCNQERIQKTFPSSIKIVDSKNIVIKIEDKDFPIRASMIVEAKGRGHFNNESTGFVEEMKSKREGMLVFRSDKLKNPFNMSIPGLATQDGVPFGLLATTKEDSLGFYTIIFSNLLSPKYLNPDNVDLRLKEVRDNFLKYVNIGLNETSWAYLARNLAQPKGISANASQRCVFMKNGIVHCAAERLTLAPLVSGEVANLVCGHSKSPPSASHFSKASRLNHNDVKNCEISSLVTKNWEDFVDEFKGSLT